MPTRSSFKAIKPNENSRALKLFSGSALRKANAVQLRNRIAPPSVFSAFFCQSKPGIIHQLS